MTASNATEQLEDKPRFFSKAWWANLARAMQPWKFDVKEHAIWQVSSGVTIFQLTGLKWFFGTAIGKKLWAVTMAIGGFIKECFV